MRSLVNRSFVPQLHVVLFLCGFLLLTPGTSPAQEQYATVARLSFLSGPVSYSRGDDPDNWDDAVENLPLSVGDRVFAPDGGQAELQLAAGNFVRLAPRSYLSTLNLRDNIKQFYLGEGSAALRIRRLAPNEVVEIDTPNMSVTLDQPGTYRISVDQDGNSRMAVRRGRATVAASGRQIAVENSEIRVYGIDSPDYEIVGLPGADEIDRWAGDRDSRFDRAYSGASNYASEEIIGVEELADHGRWESIPDYGYAWTPTAVAVGWLPFSTGRWFWQDPWGWTWISNDRWGWATSHYGRWVPYRSRWYWVPIRPRTRVRYAPAVVEFVRVRDHIGWFPLHPRDRFVPWWERRDRRPLPQNITYVNRTYVTVVNQNAFISGRSLNRYIVRDTTVLREAGSVHLSHSLPIPARTSLRIVPETGVRHGQGPSAAVLARPAVVRTAPPPPPLSFQQKFSVIQKNQGHPVAPAALQSHNQGNPASGTRYRSASIVEPNAKAFAPRHPGAASGPAPQDLPPQRGQNLAVRENPIEQKSKARERAEHLAKPATQSPASSVPPPNMGSVKRLEVPADRPRPQEAKQAVKQNVDREQQVLQQQKRREIQHQQVEQQKAREQQALIHQQQEQQKQLHQQQIEQQAREQQRQQDQLRTQQQLRQQQQQERQTLDARKQKSQEHTQLPQQKAAESKAPGPQQPQDLRRAPQSRQQQPEAPQGQGLPGQPGPSRFSPQR